MPKTIDYAARINKVADAIEFHTIKSLGFNMETYRSVRWLDIYPDKSGHNCKTVACIAGTTVSVARMSGAAEMSSIKYFDSAKNWLGLTEEQASKLFLASNSEYEFDLSRITVKKAVAVLRKLAKTGVVDWNARYRAKAS